MLYGQKFLTGVEHNSSKGVCSDNSTQLDIELSWRSVSDTTQLNSTQLSPIMNVVTQLTQFVGHDVINKNTTDLAVRCSTGSVELS